jgi:hypothetical protein
MRDAPGRAASLSILKEESMVRNAQIFMALGLLTVLVGGCDNVGNVPSGMSENDAKNAIKKMSPEDEIKFINSSPLNQADKEKRFAEIEARSGVKASEVLAGQGPGVRTGTGN